MEHRTICVDDIPEIRRFELRPDDLYVKEVDQGGHNPIRWYAIILRPSTEELFKIMCHDGENSSWHPDLPDGSVPDGITIANN